MGELLPALLPYLSAPYWIGTPATFCTSALCWLDAPTEQELWEQKGPNLT